MTIQESIKSAAERATGMPVAFLEAVPVVETCRGTVLWEGMVSVFDSQQGGVYAWAILGSSEPQFIAVLDRPPIESPIAAVRARLVSRRTNN